jgi:hypothetical protein
MRAWSEKVGDILPDLLVLSSHPGMARSHRRRGLRPHHRARGGHCRGYWSPPAMHRHGRSHALHLRSKGKVPVRPTRASPSRVLGFHPGRPAPDPSSSTRFHFFFNSNKNYPVELVWFKSCKYSLSIKTAKSKFIQVPYLVINHAEQVLYQNKGYIIYDN